MAQVLQAGSPGVVLDDSGNVIIDNDAHLAALEFYTGLYCKDKVAPEGAAQVDWGVAQNMFYQGQTALMKFWAHAYRLTPEDSKVSGKVGVAPMIAGSAGVAGIPGPWYNIIPVTAPNKDLARQYVAFAIENNALGIEAPLGLAARNSAYASYADKPGFEHFAAAGDPWGQRNEGSAIGCRVAGDRRSGGDAHASGCPGVQLGSRRAAR